LASPSYVYPRGGSLRHLALVGCTASGKSALAVELAKRVGKVEILSGDSMQVYRHMDIGTAKATSKLRGEVPHHLLDLTDPDDDFDVTRWVRAARAALTEIEARGSVALLVGGSGLYVQALLDGLDPPGRWLEIAAQLDAEPDTERLYRRLALLDPLGASRMEPTNRRRIIRALEATIGSGKPFSSFGPGLDKYPPTSWHVAGVWLPRPVVAERISLRLRDMLAEGFVEEVRSLLERPQGWSRTARQALGYRELAAHLESGVPLDQAVVLAESHTRRFSVRQRSWWRRDPRITWYETEENPLAVADAMLRDWKRR